MGKSFQGVDKRSGFLVAIYLDPMGWIFAILLQRARFFVAPKSVAILIRIDLDQRLCKILFHIRGLFVELVSSMYALFF